MTVNFEPIRDPSRFSGVQHPSIQALDRAIERVLARVDRALPQFSKTFPAPSSEGLVYSSVENVEWTNGFWTGMLWLAWDVSGSEHYRVAAEAQVETFVERADNRIEVAHHDLGFLYSPSAVAAWRLTGNREARRAALLAADYLVERFNETAGVIQAWGNLDDPEQSGRMIIDCNLNLPLLYWASCETGQHHFRHAADRHLDQAARHLVRADASTHHTYHIDTRTGMPLRGTTHQGHSDDSSWSRGQAWGIYGFALGARHGRRADLAELAEKLANFFLNRLPDDLICRWDLIFTSGSEPQDTSAAAIAACGLLELVAVLPISDPDRDTYARAAWGIIQQLDAAHLAPLDTSNGVLKDAVYHMPKRIGIDECCIWGDYFYLEALVRMRRTWAPFW